MNFAVDDYCLLNLQDGVEEVKHHKWFRGVDWDAVLLRKLSVSQKCFCNCFGGVSVID